MENIIPALAPSLPIGPLEYEQRYQDQLLNTLRLYFNRLDQYNIQSATEQNSQNVLMWAGAGSGMWSS